MAKVVSVRLVVHYLPYVIVIDTHPCIEPEPEPQVHKRWTGSSAPDEVRGHTVSRRGMALASFLKGIISFVSKGCVLSTGAGSFSTAAGAFESPCSGGYRAMMGGRTLYDTIDKSSHLTSGSGVLLEPDR